MSKIEVVLLAMIVLTPVLALYSSFVNKLPWYVVIAPWGVLVSALVIMILYLYTTKKNPFQ